VDRVLGTHRDKLGRPVSDEWAQRLGNSVSAWPAFPDSAQALARLAKHYRLIILSNVHPRRIRRQQPAPAR
jgi:FMN phosphatase YigB (HAD superfamily)